MESKERPLLSFIVVCYNQEEYICEAVEGALAQTYSPLEIIISDDASKDRTFEIASELVAKYRGQHLVRLNRNEKNLGMGQHISHLMTLCTGELVIGAAGDDVSYPERTESIFRAWDASGRRATSIFSSYMTISSVGEELGVGGTRGVAEDAQILRLQKGKLADFLSHNWPVVVGCTHAWSPRLFKFFGPLISDLEDLVLSFRSLAIGEMLYIHKPLIKYRRHGSNVSFFAGWDDTSSFDHREKRLRWVNAKSEAAYANFLGDIETLRRNQSIGTSERDSLLMIAHRMRCLYATELRLMNEGLVGKVAAIIDALKRGYYKIALRSLPRLLPLRIYRCLYMFRFWWRSRKRTKRDQ